MKKTHILILFLGVLFFSTSAVFAQAVDDGEMVYKTSKAKTPQKVRESLSKYEAYKVSEEVTYTKNKSGNKIYKFEVKKGSWTNYLLIDETGKIVGIETGEHNQ